MYEVKINEQQIKPSRDAAEVLVRTLEDLGIEAEYEEHIDVRKQKIRLARWEDAIYLAEALDDNGIEVEYVDEEEEVEAEGEEEKSNMYMGYRIKTI